MQQEPGAKQHIIPAAHIGSFSINEEIEIKRKRPIWFRRDGMQQAKDLLAEAVGVRKHIYTLNDFPEPRYVDKTWDYVEHHLGEAVNALEEHSRNPLFDGSLWVTVLVPFVAQLFCRGEEYGGLLHERAPHLETLNQAFGENSIDNINLNRLIDFQINCGLLCNAEWRLLHNQTTIPFILSDLGYAPIQAERYGYGTGRGYFIPMSKTLALVITQRLPIREPSHPPYGKKIMLLNSPLTDRNRVKFFNERVAKCAFSEVYASTEEVLKQAWGERIIRGEKRHWAQSLSKAHWSML